MDSTNTLAPTAITDDSDAAKRWLHQTQFMLSAPTFKLCPADTGREVAFAGRSNAGKSSCINALTQQRQLARSSKTPGRTQMINFFNMGNLDQRLVDLPAYGELWRNELKDAVTSLTQAKSLAKQLPSNQSLLALLNQQINQVQDANQFKPS